MKGSVRFPESDLFSFQFFDYIILDGINIESQFQEESVEAVDANATYFENQLRSIRENLGIDATMVSHEPLTPVQNKEPEVSLGLMIIFLR